MVDLLRVTAAVQVNTAMVLPDVFDDVPEKDRLDAFLASPYHALFIARIGEEIIGQIRGTLILQPDAPPELYIDNLGVAPFYQRRGIASDLIRALRGWGSDQGARSVFVLTEEENEPARQLYASLGLVVRSVMLYEQDS